MWLSISWTKTLILWQCKKQTIVATSTTEAEYVAAANCCGQVLWVQNQLLDYGFNFMNTKIHIDNESTICIVKNPVYHSKTKHIEIRHHFIRDCYEKKLISVEKIHTDLNVADLLTKPFDGPRFNYLVHVFLCFSLILAGIAWICRCKAGFAEIVDFLRGSNLRYALTTNPTIYDSLVKQFWQTATANTLADGTLELQATIDTIVYTITEASIRNKLQLADASGITMLPNNEIFEGMGHMGYPTDGSFTFWKSFFTPQWRFLVHHILHCISSKSGGWDQFGSNIATALICLSTGRVYNFSKLIFDGMVANLKSKTKFLMYPRFLQLILDIQTENKHPYLAVTLTKKIFGNMKKGFRGAPRPLLPAMLLVATPNPNAGQAHPDVAPSQPSSSTIPVPSTSLPPVQSPPPITTPIPASTPTPIPETDPEPMEHTFEEPSPAHQHFSPPQEHAQEQMSVDDLLQLVPQLMTRVDSLEKVLKQIKADNMGSAVVNFGPRRWRRWKNKYTDSINKSIPSPDKGQREGKAPMIIEEAPKKTKEQILQEEASLAEAIRLDTLEKEEEAKQEVDLQGKDFAKKMVELTSKRLNSDEAKDDESTKKTGKRRKQIARKGLHSEKTDEDESKVSKDVNPISTKNPVKPVPVADETPKYNYIYRSSSKEERIVMNRYGMDGPEDELNLKRSTKDHKLEILYYLQSTLF
ncbi:hypothetical protein Tco_0788412 [Tanacetum coccineum]